MSTEELLSLLQQQMKQQQEQAAVNLERQEERLQLQREESQKQLQLQKEESQQQLQLQKEESQQQIQLQKEESQKQLNLLRQQSDAMLQTISSLLSKQETSANRPTFQPFNSTGELWDDYWDRFCTFLEANSIPIDKAASVFLSSQSPEIYKLLSNLASQQTPATTLNRLTLAELADYMKEQFHPKRFIVRERFKFWSEFKRKPGESVQELASRIRQDAATCDFPSITDPLDEAMRTKFVCAIGNEATLKAFFKHQDEDLTFAKAIQLALEHEESAKVAKETVFGSGHGREVYTLKQQGRPTAKESLTGQ